MSEPLLNPPVATEFFSESRCLVCKHGARFHGRTIHWIGKRSTTTPRYDNCLICHCRGYVSPFARGRSRDDDVGLTEEQARGLLGLSAGSGEERADG